MKLRLGDYNQLTVVGQCDYGLLLDGGVEGEILMPRRYVTDEMKTGSELTLFVYLDQEERPVATTEKPLARVGEFVWLECSWVNEHGAFLNWGLTKDLFCPFREQKARMQVGRSYMVYILIDTSSYRIMASAKVEHFLQTFMPDDERAPLPPYRRGSEVDIIVWQPTELGYKVIVDNRFYGLLYRDQIFTDCRPGMKARAYIHNIRPDGKLDVGLQPFGRRLKEDFAEQLLEYLNNHDGQCHLSDNSSPEDIKELFHVSKKTFKRAVGDLYKRRLIIIEANGIRLTK